MIWRVGSKVPINVYEGERPVCQCHTPEDAGRIVAAMNRNVEFIQDLRDAANEIFRLLSKEARK